MSQENYRLYAFVANLYLSPLQCGLQTAHVVSEIAHLVSLSPASLSSPSFNTWAREDKTIIICGAGNHQGVLDCWAELKRTAIDTGLTCGAIFHEDEQSMNGMATACGVIVPQKYWDVQFFQETDVRDSAGLVIGRKPAYWSHMYEKGDQILEQRYDLNYSEGQFIDHIKKYRLA